MVQAKTGDTVRVHYTGFLKDGQMFDTSTEGDPFEFTLGIGMVIAGFDDALVGMSEGDTKTITIAPEDGYGEYREDLLLTLKRDQVSPEVEPEVGMSLQLRSPNGVVSDVMVKGVTKDNITLDANHPLSGKELIFEIELMEIV